MKDKRMTPFGLEHAETQSQHNTTYIGIAWTYSSLMDILHSAMIPFYLTPLPDSLDTLIDHIFPLI